MAANENMPTTLLVPTVRHSWFSIRLFGLALSETVEG